MSASPQVVYTVGHSTQPYESFLGLLRRHGIEVVADVRSVPESRWSPQFSRDVLKPALRAAGIRYVFMGDELGARSPDPACYEGKKVVFSRLAAKESFHRGIERVIEGAAQFKVALMCAEKEPTDCHRTILVSRCLAERGVTVRHILAGGEIEEHAQTMDRLAHDLKLGEPDLFRSHAESLALVYSIQEEKIAYEAGNPESAEADLR